MGQRTTFQWIQTVFGLALIAIAILALGYDAQLSSAEMEPQFKPIGQWWFELHRGSYGGVQVFLERYLWPPLWSHGLLPVIQWPVWVVAGPVGIIAFVFGRS